MLGDAGCRSPQVEEPRLAASPSIIPSSMLTSSILAPPLPDRVANGERAAKSPLLIKRATSMSLDLVRSPVMMKLVSGPYQERLPPAVVDHCGHPLDPAGGTPSTLT